MGIFLIVLSLPVLPSLLACVLYLYLALDSLFILFDGFVLINGCFYFQLKRVMESDAAMTEDLLPYNIIPLDAPTVSNPIVSFPEVIWF